MPRRAPGPVARDPHAGRDVHLRARRRAQTAAAARVLRSGVRARPDRGRGALPVAVKVRHRRKPARRLTFAGPHRAPGGRASRPRALRGTPRAAAPRSRPPGAIARRRGTRPCAASRRAAPRSREGPSRTPASTGAMLSPRWRRARGRERAGSRRPRWGGSRPAPSRRSTRRVRDRRDTRGRPARSNLRINAPRLDPGADRGPRRRHEPDRGRPSRASGASSRAPAGAPRGPTREEVHPARRSFRALEPGSAKRRRRDSMSPDRAPANRFPVRPGARRAPSRRSRERIAGSAPALIKPAPARLTIEQRPRKERGPSPVLFRNARKPDGSPADPSGVDLAGGEVP